MIIPTYNSENYILRAIDSVVNDPFVGEIIVVDDGSSDNTIGLVNLNYLENENLIVISHYKNKGACAARNLGLQKAKYEWVQFLDSDDVILKGKFERQLNLASDGNVDLIVGSYYRIENENKVQVNPYSKDIFLAFINYLIGHTNSNLWKREPLIKIRGWGENWPSGQDYEIVLRALKTNFSIKFDFEPSSVYIKRSGSISNTGSNKGWQTQVLLRLELGDYMFSEGLMNRERSIALHKVIFNKLILLKRVKDLNDEFVVLNNRFLGSPWYSFKNLVLGSPKSLGYTFFGFALTEKFIGLLNK